MTGRSFGELVKLLADNDKSIAEADVLLVLNKIFLLYSTSNELSVCHL